MMYTEVFAPFDDLLERRRVLAQTTDIPNMKAYAEAWQKLGDDFKEIGLVSNAAICHSNAKRYGEMAVTVTAVQRVQTGSFVMLESLEVQDEPIWT